MDHQHQHEHSHGSPNHKHVCWYAGMGGCEEVHSVEKTFAGGTSCHGLPRIAESSHPTRKLVWTTLVSVGLACIVWQVTLQVQNYFSWPTNTAISKHYRTNLHFPAVSICNHNRYMSSSMSTCEQELLQALAQAYAENSTLATDHFYDVVSKCNKGEFNLPKFNKDKGWHLSRDTLLNCKFNGKECDSLEDWKLVRTRLGNCYTFNSDGRVEQTQPGSMNGLFMEIDVAIDQYTYMFDDITHEGLKFLVHSPRDPPFVLLDGYEVSPGFEVSTSIRQRHHINLNEPWGKCGTKTVSACVLTCQSKHILDLCKCLPSHLPGEGNPCGVKETICSHHALAQINSELPTYCNCPVACDYDQFDVRLSYAKYPTTRHARTLAEKSKLSTDYIKSNVASIRIFYEELSFEEIEQRAAVSFGELLSDIGGQMGLFLGMSLMTTLEFMEYFLNVILRLITRTRQKKD